MRTVLISTVIWVALLAALRAENIPMVATNLVDILPYIERFAEALELDLPRPLSTNDVSRFKYSAFTQSGGIEIKRQWQFSFNGKKRLIESFTDRKRSMIVLWRPEDIKPLLRPSKVSDEGALKLARKYLARLGYDEKEIPALPPKIKPWEWSPANENTHEHLPYFTIEWPCKDRPEFECLRIEVDGSRERITHFYIFQNSPSADRL